jgi:hypothetical protein
MPTQETNLQKGLWHLRLGCGFYDETGKDHFPEFLQSIRPLIKTDERVRTALLKSPALAEMYVDGRLALEILLDELPDSAQVRFVLNYFANTLLGEDGMSTQSAHRVMAERFPDNPWLRRQVEQFARGRFLGLGHSGVYYHSDLSESDGHLLLRWALTDTRYVPRCINGFNLSEVLRLLARHPDFAIEDYDFAGPWSAVPKMFAEAKNLASEGERLMRFAMAGEVDENGQRRLVDALAEDLGPEEMLFLREIADSPQRPATTWARLLLLRSAADSAVAWDWTQKHLAAHTTDP